MNKEELRLLEAYHATFENAHGETVLEDLAKVCYENESTFCPDNQYISAAQEGRRSVLLMIRRRLAAKGTQ